MKNTYFQVLVSENYDGVPEDATWEMLDATFPPLPSGSNFTSYVSSGEIKLDRYSGKNITLAFRFQSNSSAAYCWEVKNVKVTAYTVPDGIKTIQNSEFTIHNNEAIYNLAGQRLSKMKNGFNIVNGKKILQK